MDIAGGEEVQIDITDPAQQIPIAEGMAIGFLAETEDMVKYRVDADCAAPPGCAKSYFYSVFAGAPPASYVIGTDYEFDSDGWLDGDVNGREYAFSALVEPGKHYHGHNMMILMMTLTMHLLQVILPRLQIYLQLFMSFQILLWTQLFTL